MYKKIFQDGRVEKWDSVLYRRKLFPYRLLKGTEKDLKDHRKNQFIRTIADHYSSSPPGRTEKSHFSLSFPLFFFLILR